MKNLKNIDHSKINKALSAEMPVMELNAEEQAVYFEEFTAAMLKEPTAEDDTAFAEFIRHN